MASENNAEFSTPSEPAATNEHSPPTAARPASSCSLKVPQSQNGLDDRPPISILKTTPFTASFIATIARSRGQALSSTRGKSSLNGKSKRFRARKVSFEAGGTRCGKEASQASVNEDQDHDGVCALRRWSGAAYITQIILHRPRLTRNAVQYFHLPQFIVTSFINESTPTSRHISGGSLHSRLSRHVSDGSLLGTSIQEEAPESPRCDYQPFEVVTERHAIESSSSRRTVRRVSQDAPPLLGQHVLPGAHLGASLPRPSPTYPSASAGAFNRSHSPGHYSRTPSSSRHSPDPQPKSNVDLRSVSYAKILHTPKSLNDTQLPSSGGEDVASLSTKRPLEIHRAKAKKTNDATVQYELALSLISAAAEVGAVEQNGVSLGVDGTKDHAATTARKDLLREARQVLQRLSDSSYTPAQYYLADGYASGLFNKGQEDNDHAFPLFISASKHGHVEAGYRAALCYEFGWGCHKDIQKAARFYRQSASRNHPGAMSRLGRICLTSDKGLGNRRREGVKWLKRAAESADFQYNWAPYDLGVLYETGYGDQVFQDESYAVQLFTQSANLGHAEANYRLGQAYELGKLSCPRNPTMSIHFYTSAAQRGYRLAMIALCAWYMVGAEPVLEKDENKAYEWARQAAEGGLAKAQYAIGYFTEMGIGCQRDSLGASVWYVKAADQGDDRAKRRLVVIQATAEGEGNNTAGGRIDTEGAKGNEGRRTKWSLSRLLSRRLVDTESC